ncbi:hypothetical protein B0H19DRAFT_1269938 [Mycena capillaripes]|nr:hypothetical protein B0H19DRAFT_1269938 [Mycena capillaripes]
MHLPLAFLLYLLPLLSAAPISNTPISHDPDDNSSHQAVASSTSNTPTSTPGTGIPKAAAGTSTQDKSSHSAAPSITHKPTVGTTKHHVVTPTVHPVQGGQITTRHPASSTRTFAPGPVPSHLHPPPPRHHQSMASLVFEILGALAGVIFFLSVLRCIYSYNRTPSHDRITAILHRHQLHREMEELERNPPDRRRSLVEPPPPYVAPPPSYPDDENTPLSPRHSASYGEDPRVQGPALLPPNG